MGAYGSPELYPYNSDNTDNRSYNELLEDNRRLSQNYKELKEKMDHSVVNLSADKAAVTSALSIITIVLILAIGNVGLIASNNFGSAWDYISSELFYICICLICYYIISRPKYANKRARKTIVKICGGNEDSLADVGINEIERGKFVIDSAINTYWFVREHWLCQNSDGSIKLKIVGNQYIYSVWWVVVSIQGKLYAINSQSKEKIMWIVEELRRAGYPVTKNPESDDNESE